MPRQLVFTALITAVVATVPLVAAAQPPITPEPPIDPVACGIWGCTDQAPVLPVPIPDAVALPESPPGGWSADDPPPRSELLYWQDFDSDGAVNWADNCVLVPNHDQAAAIRPPHAADPVNPSSHALAMAWKASNPGAMYRTSDELGEACSNYNDNWRRTMVAFRVSSNDRKRDIFKFLGQGGPMFGDNTLTLAVPTCSRLDTVMNILEWGLHIPEGLIANALKALLTPAITDHFGCSTGILARLAEELGQLVWAGKRLYTPTNDGGAITNRFFAPVTEIGVFDPLIKAMPWLFPGGTGQTVQGRVRNDAVSPWDGRNSIAIDWRDVSDTGIGLRGNRWPITDQSLSELLNAMIGVGQVAGPGIEGQIIRALPIALGNIMKMIPIIRDLDVQYLIYDSCRALQEGFTPCTAEIALSRPADGATRWYQEGWMPFSTVDPDILHQTAWEISHFNEMQPAFYNLPPNVGIDN
ncbi:hypothetical protein [Nocardia sp. CS682]|uniref:hypothetical protein n=1 Tax=Nocardia sp. CS682 TaxID=1047172 RepID=UPI001074C12F|nr:hypothetical protein [Nocardia sp. CS682]QBS41044.1 hypothetical protein DMB37_13895 [Nocardia sp. CS682]